MRFWSLNQMWLHIIYRDRGSTWLLPTLDHGGCVKCNNGRFSSWVICFGLVTIGFGCGPCRPMQLRRATPACGLLATATTTSRGWFIVDDNCVGMLVALTTSLKGDDVERHWLHSLHGAGATRGFAWLLVTCRMEAALGGHVATIGHACLRPCWCHNYILLAATFYNRCLDGLLSRMSMERLM